MPSCAGAKKFIKFGVHAGTGNAVFLRYPDVMVYLRTDPKVCFERMKKCDRKEETGVPLEYLRKIHEKHECSLIKCADTQGQLKNGHSCAISRASRTCPGLATQERKAAFDILDL